MRIGILFGLGEVVVGICTANPILITSGAARAAKSYVIGEALEPIKGVISEALSDSGASDVVEVINTVTDTAG